MSTSLMKKLTLVAPRSESDRLVKKLMWLRCVEINSDVSDSENELLVRNTLDSERNELSKNINITDSAIAALRKYGESKKGLFSGKIEIERSVFKNTDVSESLKFAQEVNSVYSRVLEVTNEINKKKTDITALGVWENYDIPLDVAYTANTEVRIGTLPQQSEISEMNAEISASCELAWIEQVHSDSAARYVFVVNHKSVSESLNRILATYGFSKIEFRSIASTPSEQIRELESELKTLNSELGNCNSKLVAMSNDIGKLEIAYDFLRTELSACNAQQNLFCTQSTVYMTAWVPEKAEESITKVLEEIGCWYDFEEPTEEDEVPVLLQNNSLVTPFESVVSMYALPLYGSFDPTLIMSLFYFVTFGIMLADVFYGLLVSIGAFILMKMMRPARGSGMDNMLRLFMICGISCVVAGVIFGSYFGDLLSVLGIKVWSAMDIVNDPISLLIVAIALGVLQMFCGMGINFYMLCKRGKVLDAIFDVGSWYVLYIGIGVLLINSEIGKWIALAGVAMLVLTQGRREKNIFMKLFKGVGSLYNIINFVSDLLSYSRIMALGLSSAVIAMVVNMVGNMGGIVGIIIAILIGHTLNLVLNLLGTYVHTGRLQYIEFFGKFYEDGGKAFDPVLPDTKYTQIIFK